jgi:hypothetical protein
MNYNLQNSFSDSPINGKDEDSELIKLKDGKNGVLCVLLI